MSIVRPWLKEFLIKNLLDPTVDQLEEQLLVSKRVDLWTINRFHRENAEIEFAKLANEVQNLPLPDLPADDIRKRKRALKRFKRQYKRKEQALEQAQSQAQSQADLSAEARVPRIETNQVPQASKTEVVQSDEATVPRIETEQAPLSSKAEVVQSDEPASSSNMKNKPNDVPQALIDNFSKYLYALPRDELLKMVQALQPPEATGSASFIRHPSLPSVKTEESEVIIIEITDEDDDLETPVYRGLCTPVAKSEADTDAEANANAGANTEVNADAETNAYAEANANTYAAAIADAHNDAHNDAHTDAHTHTESHTEAQTDADSEADDVSDCCSGCEVVFSRNICNQPGAFQVFKEEPLENGISDEAGGHSQCLADERAPSASDATPRRLARQKFKKKPSYHVRRILDDLKMSGVIDKGQTQNRRRRGSKGKRCGLANSAFSHSDFERIILGTPASERVFNCDKCEAAFRHKFVLKRHKIAAHPRDRLYTCAPCGASFKSKKSVERHILANHALKCEKCGSTFSSKKSLERHELTHAQDPVNRNWREEWLSQLSTLSS